MSGGLIIAVSNLTPGALSIGAKLSSQYEVIEATSQSWHPDSGNSFSVNVRCRSGTRYLKRSL